MARELLLYGGHERVEAVDARHLGVRVDVGAVLGPCLLDDEPAALGIGLVPHRDVAVDDGGHFGHLMLLGDRLTVATVTGTGRVVDYLRG